MADASEKSWLMGRRRWLRIETGIESEQGHEASSSTIKTYLKTSASRVALLLLGTFDARGLSTRALAARRLALSASHGVLFLLRRWEPGWLVMRGEGIGWTWVSRIKSVDVTMLDGDIDGATARDLRGTGGCG